ncbi:MAG: hypothetical protein WCX80_02620 [Patescibacteria group bacterium]
MKNLIIVLVCLISGLAYGQTESNNFELKYNGSYSATPTEVLSIDDVLDTFRLGESNAYDLGAGMYLNCGLGVEGGYRVSNRYFDTLAGGQESYSIGLSFKKVVLGPGSLFDEGFNTAFKFGAGYFHADKIDQIEYINIEDVSRIWKRNKISKGFYLSGGFNIFRDSPEFIDFYGISFHGSYKNSISSILSESIDDKLIKGRWGKEDSVGVVSVGVEVKPVIFPLGPKSGLSLITTASYSNFNGYNVYDPGATFQVGFTLEGFHKLGECVRIVYVCAPRENYISNGINVNVDLIQTCRTLFGR